MGKPLREMQRIVEERNAFRANQFQLESNFRAHYLHTGPEVIRQSAGLIEAFCDFAGTGGSFQAVPPPSGNIVFPFCASSSSQRAQPFWQANRSPIPTIASRVADTPFQIFPC